MSKYAPAIPIQLDKARNIKLDFNAMRLIEMETGKNTLSPEIWQNMTATDMVVFLWACLAHEDKELTLDEVGKLVHPGNIGQISEALTKALGVSMPKAEGTTQSSGTGDAEKNTSSPTG